MRGFAADLSFGATLIASNRTRFRLWAPAARRVSVAIEDRAPVSMHREAGGWFEAFVACGAGTRYRYRLDDGTLVPDPASRRQDGDVGGASIVVDPSAYSWRNAGWQGRPWHETVLYELHVGLCGGFAGTAEKLPELAELGVTAVELMPIAEFPGSRNWGYDGVLPYAPESTYGSPDDLKALIDRAHGLGLMVFLDVVYNHFGPEGNWIGRYAPEFFRSDMSTPWGDAVDFRRPEVSRFFIENAIYWLQEYRFDGLRFDAVHAIEPVGWLSEMAGEVRAHVEYGRHVHFVLENDDNLASLLEDTFDAQWNDDAHHVLHVLLTGQAEGYYADYAEAPTEKLLRALREGFVFQGEPSTFRGGRRRGESSARLSPTSFVLFLQNHDQIGNRAFGERLTTLADPDALRAAVALQLLSPHIPLVFMGEEEGSRRPFLYFTDYRDELADAVREGRRREFAAFPPFADPEKRESIPDPNDPATFEASNPFGAPAADDRQDWRALYRHLLSLRADVITRRLVGARALDGLVLGEGAVLVRWRLGDGALLVIVANLGAHLVPVPDEIRLPSRAPFYAGRAGLDPLKIVPATSTFAWLEPAA